MLYADLRLRAQRESVAQSSMAAQTRAARRPMAAAGRELAFLSPLHPSPHRFEGQWHVLQRLASGQGEGGGDRSALSLPALSPLLPVCSRLRNIRALKRIRPLSQCLLFKVLFLFRLLHLRLLLVCSVAAASAQAARPARRHAGALPDAQPRHLALPQLPARHAQHPQPAGALRDGAVAAR